MKCFYKAGIGNYIKRQQAKKAAGREVSGGQGVVVGPAMLWTQQLIKSDVNTVTLHDY